MKSPLFKTSRLGFRRVRMSDFPVIRDLYADPRVTRYVPPFEPTDKNILRRMSEVIALYDRDDRFGIWIAYRLTDDVPIGWFQLRPLEEAPAETEVGYRLLPLWWGYGYATEGTNALVKRGLRDFGLPRVVARTHPENAASIGVLEKCGFTRCETRGFPESNLPVIWYEITRAAALLPEHSSASDVLPACRCQDASKTGEL